MVWKKKKKKKKGISRKKAPDVYTQEIYKNSGLPGMETVKAWVMKAVPCDGLKVCVPLNWYVKALTSNVMVLGDGSFGRWWGLEEGMKVGPSWWHQSSLKTDWAIRVSSLYYLRAQQENGHL